MSDSVSKYFENETDVTFKTKKSELVLLREENEKLKKENQELKDKVSELQWNSFQDMNR